MYTFAKTAFSPFILAPITFVVISHERFLSRIFKYFCFSLQQKQNSHNKQRSRLFNNCNDRTFNEFSSIYLLVEAAARSSSAKMVLLKILQNLQVCRKLSFSKVAGRKTPTLL